MNIWSLFLSEAFQYQDIQMIHVFNDILLR